MRISDQVSGYIEAAIERHSQGEDVDFDLSLTVMPTREGFAPVYVLLVTMPGALIGERAHACSLIQNVALSEEEAQEAVRQMCEGIRAGRSQALTEAMANPTKTSPSGLILGG